MPFVTYIFHDGTRTEVDAPAGASLMSAAVNNGIEGILADCGGCLTCGTCHCYIDEAWAEKLPAPTEEESLMIEMGSHVKETSRLSCQVILTDEMNGLTVHVPESQY